MHILTHKHVEIPALHIQEGSLLRADWVVYRFKFLSCLLAVDGIEHFHRRTECWEPQGPLERALPNISQQLALEVPRSFELNRNPRRKQNHLAKC
jgi:hypothetical protein